MYPFGHFALSYFLVLLYNRFRKADYHLLILFFASILPDFDLLFYGYIPHRGPTHSIIIMTVFFIPFYVSTRSGVSYYMALLSHSMIGDLFTGSGVQLFWPLSKKWFHVPYRYKIMGKELVILESILFLAMLIHIYFNRKKSKRCPSIIR